MPTFTANKPASNETLAVSQPLIMNNLDFLQQAGNIDHVFTGTSTPSPTNPPAASNGWHKTIHMSPQALPVGAIAGGQLFANSANVTGGGVQLVYEDSLGVITQLTTTSGVNGNVNGRAFLPGGMMMQWGQVTGLSGAWPSGLTDLNFPVAYQSACYNVQATFTAATNSSSSTGEIIISATATNKFTWGFTGSSSANFTGFFWVSIGL